MSAPSRNPKGQDNVTRNIVIAMILVVVLAGAGAALLNYRTNNSTATPTIATKSSGFGLEFNLKINFYVDLVKERKI